MPNPAPRLRLRSSPRPPPRAGASLVAALALAAAPAASAWGPGTHRAINQAGLAAVSELPGFEHLAEAEHARRFVGGGAAADLTFDIVRGGKTDPELNALLHRREFHDHLLARARDAGDPAGLAFAAGLAGHLAGDLVGNRPGGPLSVNLFGFPEDQDVWGRPVSDFRDSAAWALRHMTSSVNKIVVDALLRADDTPGADAPLVVEAEFLAEGIASYRGPSALDPDNPPVAKRVARATKSFRRSLRALKVLTWRMARNGGFQDGLRAAIWGPDQPTYPGFEESVAALPAMLVGPGGAGPSASVDPGWAAELAEEAGHLEGGDHDHHAEGALAHGCRSPDQEILIEVIRELGGEPRRPPAPAAPGELAGLKKRVLEVFFWGAVRPFQDWESLRAKVRALVPVGRGSVDPATEAETGPVLPDLMGLIPPR